MPTGLHPSVDDDGSHELETALPHAFEIVSDRGVFAGIVLPSPTTTRSLITDLPSGRHHDKTGAWEMHTDLSDRGIAASDRSPGQALQTKTEPNFLRIGRGLVVMQDDIGHRDGPRFGMIVPLDIKCGYP